MKKLMLAATSLVLCAFTAQAETTNITVNTTWNNADIAALDPDVTINIASAKKLTLNITEAIEIPNTITGEGMLVKAGGGTLTISGANTFSGGVEHMTGGTLIMTSPSALGTGKVTFQYSLHYKCAGGTIANDFDLRSQWTSLNLYNTSETVPLNISGKITSSNNAGYLQLWTYGYTGETMDEKYVYNFGEIYLPNTPIRKLQKNSVIDDGKNGRGGTLHFLKKVTTSQISCFDPAYGHWHFHATNEVGIAGCSGAYWHFEAPDVFPDTVFSSTYYRDDTYEPSATYIFHGNDQNVGALYSRTKMNSLTPTSSQSIYKSTEAATLTIGGAVDTLWSRTGSSQFASQSNHAKFDGALSLVYDPSDAGLSVFSNRAHTMTGTITVKKGTFATSAATSFKNATALTVASGATFRLGTTVASALAGLKTLTVGGTYDVSAAAGVPTPTDLALAVTDGGKVILPANATMTVKSLTTNGVAVVGGFTAENCDWIEGAGASVSVRAVWTQADYDAYEGDTITVAEGGELEFAYDSTMSSTIDKVIAGGGAVRVTGAGTITFAAANTFSGGFTMLGTGSVKATAATGYGTGKITLAGTGKLCFDGAGITFANDIDVTEKGYISVYMPTKTDKFTLAGDINATSDFYLHFRNGYYMASDSGDWPYDFAGAIYAPGKVITVRGWYPTFCTFNFRKAVTCDKFVLDPTTDLGHAYLHFFAENEMNLLSPMPGAAFEIDNALSSNVWLTACWGRNNSYHNGAGNFNLKGHVQTVGKLHSEDLNRVLQGSTNEKYFSSPAGGVLTLGGSVGDYVTRATLNAGLDFVFAPADGARVVFTNQTHATEGSITVAKGTMATAAAASFPNLTKLVVKSGAVFELNTTVAQALGGLKTLRVEDGGILRVTASPEHFLGGLAELVIDGTGSLELPDGVSADFAIVRRNGVILPDDTYTSANSDWITGSGSVKADSSTTSVNYWKTAANGTWKTGANWTKGAAPTSGQTAAVTAPGASYTATVDEDAVAAALEIGNDRADATATVSLGAKLTVPNSLPITVADGGVLAVADGGIITNDNVTGQIVVKKGGKLTVAEGGQIFLRHAEAKPGNGICVKKGGAVEMTGGSILLDMPNKGNTYSLLTLEGGSFTASGDAHVAFGGSDNYQTLFFGTGTARFEGNSTFGHIKFGQRRGPFFGVTESGTTSVVEFVDHAAFGVAADGRSEEGWCGTDTRIGTTVNSMTGTAIVRFASDATHSLGYSTTIGESVSGSRGELHIEGGQAQLLYNNLSINNGLLKVTGGSYYSNGGPSEATYYNTLYGIQVGNGCSITAGQEKPAEPTQYGELFVGGAGAVTNVAPHGRVAAGIGTGKGLVRQEGGHIQHNRTAAIVGAFGGIGIWQQTGGTANLPAGIYVGGVTTNELGVFVKFTSSKTVFPVDWHDAEGTLELDGGAMTLGKLVLSADGVGTLALGTNANLTVTGALDARTGSKLRVDITGYKGKSRTLATFGSCTQGFDEANIERIGETPSCRVIVKPDRIRVQQVRGLIVVFR